MARRTLGTLSLAALGLNTVVGSGIFLLPAELARDAGALSVALPLVGALCLAPVAVAYGLAARACPDEDGGAYASVLRAFGARPAIVVGWGAYLATLLTWATMARAVAEMVAAGAGSRALLAVALLVATGAVSASSVRAGAALSSALVVAKLAPLIVLAFASIGPTSIARVAIAPPAAPLSALLPIFFALSGFETSAVAATITAHPERTVQRATLLALFGAAALYASLQIGCILHVHRIAESTRPLQDLAAVTLGGRAASLVTVLAGVSMLGTASAMAVAAPRLLGALARAGLGPRRLAHQDATRLHAGASALLAAALVVALDFRGLVDVTAIVLVVQYGAACASVLRLGAQGAIPGAAARVPWSAVLGLAPLPFLLSAASPRELAVGAGAVALGAILPLRRREPAAPP